MHSRVQPGRLKEAAADAARYFGSVHRPNGRPNACILSAPRSGSTWLLELILTQPGFKPCSEPFDLRKKAVSRRLGIERWEQLNDETALPQAEAYLRSFLENRYSAAFKGLRPGLPHYRLITRRIAFKILFGFEHRVDWLRGVLDAGVVLLLRHPVPVALSRKALPRLGAFLSSEFRDFLTQDQRRVADAVVRRGEHLPMAVVDWCLEYSVPLQHFRNSLLPVTYEQLVIDPEPALEALAAHLDLDRVDLMRKHVGRPSASTSKSSAETADFLRTARDDRRWLVEKWRPRVSEHQERSLMELVEAFGIDAYRSGDCMPSRAYWL